jgi:hypothetical protein
MIVIKSYRILRREQQLNKIILIKKIIEQKQKQKQKQMIYLNNLKLMRIQQQNITMRINNDLENKPMNEPMNEPINNLNVEPKVSNEQKIEEVKEEPIQEVKQEEPIQEVKQEEVKQEEVKEEEPIQEVKQEEVKQEEPKEEPKEEEVKQEEVKEEVKEEPIQEKKQEEPKLEQEPIEQTQENLEDSVIPEMKEVVVENQSGLKLQTINYDTTRSYNKLYIFVANKDEKEKYENMSTSAKMNLFKEAISMGNV